MDKKLAATFREFGMHAQGTSFTVQAERAGKGNWHPTWRTWSTQEKWQRKGKGK